MIKITVTDEGIPMVWNSEDLEKLRNEHRILGTFCGTLADFPSQERYHGLPLVLLPYEATLLHEKRIGRLVRYPSLMRAPGKGVKEEYEKYCRRICNGQIASLMKQQTGTNERIQNAEEQQAKLEISKTTSSLSSSSTTTTTTKHRRKCREKANNTNHLSLLSLAVEKLEEEEELREFMPLANSLCVQTFTTYPWLRKEDACTVKWKYPSTSAENLSFKVFKDFWEKGYYVSPGHKFGADFLVYPGDPCIYSAHFLVICIERNAAIRPVDVAVFCRLGDAMSKSVILACETNSNQITYQTLKCSFLSK